MARENYSYHANKTSKNNGRGKQIRFDNQYHRKADIAKLERQVALDVAKETAKNNAVAAEDSEKALKLAKRRQADKARREAKKREEQEMAAFDAGMAVA